MKNLLVDLYHTRAPIFVDLFSFSGLLLQFFDARHHGDELLELNLAVAVLIHLLYNLVDCLDAQRVGAAEAENLSDFVGRNNSRAVLIEHAESGVELLLRGETALVRCGDDEFCVVDEATVVGVNGPEHLFDFLVAHDSSVVLQVALLDLIHAELAVAVFVEGLENLRQVVALLFAHQLRGDERVGRLLEGDIAVELAEVVQGVHGELLVNLERGQLSDPRVLQSLLSRGALLRVVGQQRADEALAVLRDGLPDAVVERVLALANLLHDVLVGLAVEGRHSGKEDVGDDTSGPDVALMVVVLVENLGGDVVGRAQLLVKVTVGVVDKGSAEVDDLDLIELLVLLEQDILGLQVTVDDVGLVAVVDAGEHLLHEDGTVSLAELAALQDLVEELSTFADLGDEVVALLIFEELVHLDDVWVVLSDN